MDEKTARAMQTDRAKRKSHKPAPSTREKAMLVESPSSGGSWERPQHARRVAQMEISGTRAKKNPVPRPFSPQQLFFYPDPNKFLPERQTTCAIYFTSKPCSRFFVLPNSRPALLFCVCFSYLVLLAFYKNFCPSIVVVVVKVPCLAISRRKTFTFLSLRTLYCIEFMVGHEVNCGQMK